MISRLFLLLGLVLIAPAARADDGQRGGRMVAPGGAAPAFAALPVLNEKQATASRLGFEGRPGKGERVWILSFFATWCPGCVNEMPMLRKLNEDYRARGVRVVSVSVDKSPNAESQIKALVEKNQIKHPILVDADQQVLRLYQGGSTSLPYIFVIGPDGVVAKVHEGFDAATDGHLRETIDQLLSTKELVQNR
jgi:peroxiredoxin